MAPRDANIIHMLAEIESLGQNLTKWEEEFVHDVQARADAGKKLTDYQYEKLQQIYQEKVR